MKTIRASEVGTYLYCQRAWWYQKQGLASENQGAMTAGTRLHESHGRTVMATGCLRTLAYTFLLLALVLAVVYWTLQVL